jgi:hypothetical protein
MKAAISAFGAAKNAAIEYDGMLTANAGRSRAIRNGSQPELITTS